MYGVLEYIPNVGWQFITDQWGNIARMSFEEAIDYRNELHVEFGGVYVVEKLPYNAL
jgi:hypothetical protein